MKKPYCRPLNAGLASETGSVCRRLSRLFRALETEINQYIVEGPILDDLRACRLQLMDRLKAEGWDLHYATDDDRMRVHPPKGR